MIRIALDVMGGDNAPASNIDGAIDFLTKSNNSIQIYLVGIESEIKKRISNIPKDVLNQIKIIHASEVVDSNDSPSRIFKNKPDSSMIKAIELLKEEKVNAIISAGNTGCLLSASFFKLGLIEGIKRPALFALVPSENGNFLLCDVGANPIIKPNHLLQFGRMCKIYMKYEMKIKNPKVSLLNIGSEKNKGTELTKTAYSLLEKELDNFIGNIESRDIFDGTTDIVLCDGFSGNIVLKLIEGMANYNINLISSKLDLRDNHIINNMKKTYDYEEYGATPILGIKGLVFKSHGSSSKIAIKNALNTALDVYKLDLINKIQSIC